MRCNTRIKVHIQWTCFWNLNTLFKLIIGVKWSYMRSRWPVSKDLTEGKVVEGRIRTCLLVIAAQTGSKTDVLTDVSSLLIQARFCSIGLVLVKTCRNTSSAAMPKEKWISGAYFNATLGVYWATPVNGNRFPTEIFLTERSRWEESAIRWNAVTVSEERRVWRQNKSRRDVGVWVGGRLLTLSFAAVSSELVTLSSGCLWAAVLLTSLATLASLQLFHRSFSQELRCASSAVELLSVRLSVWSWGFPVPRKNSLCFSDWITEWQRERQSKKRGRGRLEEAPQWAGSHLRGGGNLEEGREQDPSGVCRHLKGRGSKSVEASAVGWIDGCRLCMLL